MKQTFKMVFSVLLFSMMALTGFAQNAKVTITGKVIDKDGLGVIGLNVIEKGTKNGTLTDIDGAYKIQVPKGAVLQYSYVGMKTQERTVGASATVNITMLDDASTLNEVVVVGYGTQKKSQLTGAVVTIKPDDIQELPVSNLTEALRGQIPGVAINGGSQRPGSAADIQIRQTFSFSKDGGSKLPLVIIDDMIQVDSNGLPTMDTFNRLDPTEIESITVLKDGSAAIYGSRAAQGAIIVKTKRGKEGPTKLSYQSQFSVNDAISHSKTMSAYEYGLWANRFLTTDNRTNNGANLFTEAELEEMKGLDYNWLKKAWKPAVQQKHALNASGGNDKATYFAGATYYTQGANLGKQDYNKWTFRAGSNIKISNSLDLSTAVSVNTTDLEKSFTKASANISDGSYGSAAGGGEQADYGYLLHMPKYIPWETTVGDETYYMSPFPRTDRNFGGVNNRSIAGWNYFATLNNGSKQTSNDFSYNVNMSLTYKVPFLKGLALKGTFARSQSNSYTEQVQLPFVLARIKNYNSAGHHLASQALDKDYSIDTNTSNARVYYTTDYSKNIQANFFATYDRTFGDHSVSAMASIEKTESDNHGTRLAYEGTTNDYAGSYQTAGTLSTSNSTATKGEAGTLSYLGRLNYSYKDKYLAQFIFRTDASTKFAPENYWGFFPGVQLGWIASKEDWFEKIAPGIDYMKFRYSWGKTGRDNVQAWRWIQYYDIITDKGYQFGSNGGVLASGVSPRVNPNRNVGWDTDIKNNFGIDMNVLRNRLQLTADFYYDRNKDMLTNVAGIVDVPISVGGGFAEQNFSAVDAWGAEFSLNWSDKVKDDFSYNVGVNFGFNGNKVKKYPEQALLHPSNNQTIEGRSLFFPSWGFQTWNETSTGDGILRTDEDIQNYWNYLTERATAAGTVPKFNNISSITDMRKGMIAYKDVGGAYDAATNTQAGPDGQITKNLDYVKLGNSNKTYGFTTNFGMKFKGFFAKTQIATSWGGVRMIDFVKQGTSSSHSFWAHESFWKDMYGYDNVDGKYPSLANYDDQMVGAPSNFWQVGTFRCVVRNLTLGYGLPKEVLKSLNIDGLNFGLTGYNLWDLYNPYPDHYRNMYDSSYESYPTLRSWTLNINVSF